MSIQLWTASRNEIAHLRQQVAALQDRLAFRRRERICCEVKYELAAARFETAMVRFAHVSQKAGFKEDQPRWPQGTPGEPKPGGRWSGGPGTIFVNNAVTGFSTIDSTTEKLGKTLATVINTLPPGRGPVYGIAVHTAFSFAVRFGNFPGIGFKDVETTWGGVDLRYGSLGSLRTDVVLRNDSGEPIAIYDVKTGGAKLKEDRVQELREAVAPGRKIPVIELHLSRGANLKGFVSSTAFSTYVSATSLGLSGVRQNVG